MSYRDEFPDFDPATMPEIPPDWVDESWHKDACPQFSTPSGYNVFVDYLNPAERETGGARFVAYNPDTGLTLIETDQFWEVVELVTTRKLK